MADEADTEEIARWLGRLRDGDPAARGELIQRTQGRLRLITRRMLRRFPTVRRWDDTSDVFQDALLRLDRALRAVEVPTPADYLRLAAHHVRLALIDLARSRELRTLLHGTPPPGSGRVLDPTAPGDDAATLEFWERFHATAGALPPPLADVFGFLWYDGMKQPEAAAALGIPLRSLKRYWQEARIALAAQLRLEPDATEGHG